MTDSYEEEQRVLDPHRLEEQHRAREETEDRLRSRGIKVYPRDRIGSSEPGVPPTRGPEESASDYRLRVEAAIDRLRRRPGA